MYKKSGYTIIIIGVVLLFAALSLFLYNEAQNMRTEEASSKALSSIKEHIIQELKTGSIDVHEIDSGETSEDSSIPQMYSVNIDGIDYIGYISIPSLGIELPVISEWGYDELDIAPCRYTGSTYEGNFVIAGHNYRSQFSPLKNIEIGSEVIFTDMHGVTWNYTVYEVEVVNPTDIEQMTTSEYELSLFTCTYGGQARHTVRCVLNED